MILSCDMVFFWPRLTNAPARGEEAFVLDGTIAACSSLFSVCRKIPGGSVKEEEIGKR